MLPLLYGNIFIVFGFLSGFLPGKLSKDAAIVSFSLLAYTTGTYLTHSHFVFLI